MCAYTQSTWTAGVGGVGRLFTGTRVPPPPPPPRRPSALRPSAPPSASRRRGGCAQAWAQGLLALSERAAAAVAARELRARELRPRLTVPVRDGDKRPGEREPLCVRELFGHAKVNHAQPAIGQQQQVAGVRVRPEDAVQEDLLTVGRDQLAGLFDRVEEQRPGSPAGEAPLGAQVRVHYADLEGAR